ncbi:MAG: antibiotic biosynthesis monooxygenase [Thermodesulfobacteriota bacterium]|jgi:quinol monooxygenase YgiN
MSILTVIAQVKPGKRREFLYTLTSLYSNREEEEGLKEFTLYLITEWETQKDLERHLHTEKFEVLNGALQVLCAKSEIRHSPIAEKEAEVPKSKP